MVELIIKVKNGSEYVIGKIKKWKSKKRIMRIKYLKKCKW